MYCHHVDYLALCVDVDILCIEKNACEGGKTVGIARAGGASAGEKAPRAAGNNHRG